MTKEISAYLFTPAENLILFTITKPNPDDDDKIELFNSETGEIEHDFESIDDVVDTYGDSCYNTIEDFSYGNSESITALAKELSFWTE